MKNPFDLNKIKSFFRGTSAAPSSETVRLDVSDGKNNASGDVDDVQKILDNQEALYADLERDMGGAPVEQWFYDPKKLTVVDPASVIRGDWVSVPYEPPIRVVVGQSEQGWHYALERQADPGAEPDAAELNIPVAQLKWSRSKGSMDSVLSEGKCELDQIVEDADNYYKQQFQPDPPIDVSNDIPGEPGYGTGGECYRNEAGQLHRDRAEGPARIVSSYEQSEDYTNSQETAYYVENGILLAIQKSSYVGDCEGYVDEEEWLDSEGRRHREDGIAYKKIASHNIPSEVYLDESVEEYWIHGKLEKSVDRTYQDLLSNRSLAERQYIGVDVDGPDYEEVRAPSP